MVQCDHGYRHRMSITQQFPVPILRSTHYRSGTVRYQRHNILYFYHHHLSTLHSFPTNLPTHDETLFSIVIHWYHTHGINDHHQLHHLGHQ